MVLRNISV